MEILSTDFALGWAERSGSEASIVYATLDGRIIGFSEANIQRPDLSSAASASGLAAGAFVIVYKRAVPQERATDVLIWSLGEAEPIVQAKVLRIDPAPKLQVIILGSPRSGTSELGATLSEQLKLPWLGEGHGAPLFSAAAKSLAGDATSGNGLVRFLAQNRCRDSIIEATKRAYYYMHGSASFIDKTPGVPMISATPFMLECFPAARVVYLRRNGISNVLSRMTKFGGNFEAHCADWAAALNEWTKIQDCLPHYLELQQEEMLAEPEAIADRLARYLGVPEMGHSISQSLRSGSRERTGAGLGSGTLSQSGWSTDQISRFRRICGGTMEAFGYPME